MLAHEKLLVNSVNKALITIVKQMIAVSDAFVIKRRELAMLLDRSDSWKMNDSFICIVYIRRSLKSDYFERISNSQASTLQHENTPRKFLRQLIPLQYRMIFPIICEIDSTSMSFYSNEFVVELTLERVFVR